VAKILTRETFIAKMTEKIHPGAAALSFHYIPSMLTRNKKLWRSIFMSGIVVEE